jgi:hypothetical protein
MAALLLLALTGCGGGSGGGGGNGSGPTQQLQLSTTQLNITSPIEGTVAAQTITGTVSGNPQTVYARVVATSSGITSISGPTVDGTSATIGVQLRMPGSELQPALCGQPRHDPGALRRRSGHGRHQCYRGSIGGRRGAGGANYQFELLRRQRQLDRFARAQLSQPNLAELAATHRVVTGCSDRLVSTGGCRYLHGNSESHCRRRANTDALDTGEL